MTALDAVRAVAIESGVSREDAERITWAWMPGMGPPRPMTQEDADDLAEDIAGADCSPSTFRRARQAAP